ncbi:PREDICTED: uncharacterized protein LOC101815666 [Ficedula albicollis]|uniref:uncharacterized protein LOC101815666 n=1 Tax=Ficedula albicollis TaxID=59894 RepID=UPI0003592B43|nr:PREDICTED: uncharacterized protein LOC101815666 [Ficedula albicollis]
MGPGMKAVGCLEPQTGEFRFYLQHAREFCFPVTTCAVIVNFLLQQRSNSPLPWKGGLYTAGESRRAVAILTWPRPQRSPVPACRSSLGLSDSAASEDLCLSPVPSCVYPRKHFCLLGSESPRSGSPSPACCEQEGEWKRGGVWAAFLLLLGLGLLCNATHGFCRGTRIKWGWRPWLLLHSPARHSVAVTLSREQPACPVHGLQLVPSPVAPSLLVLQASWDTATALGTWLCHTLSWADPCQFPQELQAGDFPDGETGAGPSSCLPQAVWGILCGWSKLSLCSFCCAISFAVDCICCSLAQSS